MPYRCISKNGDIDGTIFHNLADAQKRAQHLSSKCHLDTSYWSWEEIKSSNGSFTRTGNSGFINLNPLFLGIVSMIVALLTWLVSTKIGRKVLIILFILWGILYVKNVWENRAYVAETYYENGNIKIEQAFKSKKLNGISKYYLENGQLEKEENYKDGELDGEFILYYCNGKVKEKSNYQVGKRHGASSFYRENGIISKEENYKDGKLDGVLIEYYENGIISKEQNYKKDVKNGSSKVYYPSGTLKSEAMVVNNKLHGLSILYDEQGKILRKEKFENGKSTNIIE